MPTAIESVRSFNRFFTRHVGAIDERFLDTDASLPEARLLFEIAKHERVAAHLLQAELKLDRGYLSRLLARFEERNWISRDRLETDGRARPISLTREGREAFDQINDRQRSAVAEVLDRLSTVEQNELVHALTKIRLLLDPMDETDFSIRGARVGEVSQVAARQSVLYAASHGWGRELEVLEAQTTATFLRDFNPDREQCWVADIGGLMVGAVFLTDEGQGIARLRLLHVEPYARRRGIGDALVSAAVSFAREKAYSGMTLWTHTVLSSARRIYAQHGFVNVATAVHHEFGVPVEGETWHLDLTAQTPVIERRVDQMAP